MTSTSTSELEPFDPLSEGRAPDAAASHTTLLQRGRVLQQLREEVRRRESYSVQTRRVSSALLVSVPTAMTCTKRLASSRRLLLATSETAAHTSVSHEQNHALSPATVAIAQSHGADTDADTLVRSAVLAQWIQYRVATGFRRWKEATRAPTDLLARFGSDVELTSEARRIFLAADAERQAALQEVHTSRLPAPGAGPVGHAPAKTTANGEREHDDNTAALVVSPRALESAGVKLSRAELDVLTVWAKELHGKTFRGVDDASVCEVVRFLRLRTYRDGEPLFFEGETGETFYIIFQGTVGVFVGMPAATKAALSPLHRENTHTHLDWRELGKRVFTYRTGDCFGETAMFSSDATRTASAVAVGPCEVCELDRDVYRRTLSRHHQQFFEQAQKLNFLQRVPLFRELPRHKMTALADALEKKRFHFGETLIAERGTTTTISGNSSGSSSGHGSGTAPRACFLILSGVVKLTQCVEVPGQSHALTPVEAAAAGIDKKAKAKKKPIAHMKMELQTVVSNEIVGLEALLHEPLHHTNGSHTSPATYAATASSAHVDVYVLKESDARSFVGGSHSALGHKIQRICDAEAVHRERRRKQTQQGLLHNQQDAADAQDAREVHGNSLHQHQHHHRADGTSAVRGRSEAIASMHDSVDLAVAAPESPRSPGSAARELGTAMALPVSALVPGLQTVKQPSAISDGTTAPYLPHLRATHLFPSTSLGASASVSSPRGDRQPSPRNDLSVVSSPKMLSSCVRKFLFEHSDTLAHDYVARLSHQFPSPVPPPQPHTLLLSAGSSCVAAAAVTSRAQREDQRVLDQQLSKMYDRKMHWDAKTRDFVVAPPPSSLPSTVAMADGTTTSPRAGFLSSAPRLTGSSDAPQGRGRGEGRDGDGESVPHGHHATARRKSSFQKELKATQHTARKLVEDHLKRVGGSSSSNNNHGHDARGSGGASFLHFFADA